MQTLFELLAHERALAEGHAGLLHAMGRGDPRLYAEGILAYVQAKAAFDALIEAAKHHLISGVDLREEVAGFRLKVDTAVRQRLAFSRLVENRVLAATAATKGVTDPADAATLGKTLVDLVLALLKPFLEADAVRRKETLAQFDGLKWRPFEDLIRTG